jgi:transposase
MAEEVEWFAGIDWASESHQVCLVDARGKCVGECAVAHGGAGIEELCDWLIARTGAKPATIAVAIEMPRGPVVEALLERGFCVHAINPRQLDRFRDRFTVAGAKDDRRDAHVLADSLRTDRHAFRPLSVDDPVIVELREWSRIADDLQQERNRLANRMREQLWRYYPQMLALADDLAANWVVDLWIQAPTPAKAARLRETTVERFLQAHRIRRWQAPEILRILKQKPLSVAPGVVEAAIAHIRTLTARTRLVNQQLRAAHRRLDELCDQLVPPEETEPGPCCEQRDVVILRSLPGLGRINLAVLLAEAWQPLRRRDYHDLRCLSGVAPVTRRSGKSCIVLRRYACNKRLENALYYWARRDPARQAQSLPLCRVATAWSPPRPRPAHRCRSLALRRLHAARAPEPVRPQLPGSRGRRVSVWFHPFVRPETTIASSQPAVRQSTARSGSQGCRRKCGGTGTAGAQRPRQSEHGATLSWRGRFPARRPLRGYRPALLCLTIGGRSSPRITSGRPRLVGLYVVMRELCYS